MSDKIIPPYIEKLTRPDDLKTVMQNAKSKGRMDVYWVAFRRLCDIEGKNYNDPLHMDFYAMLTAYESFLSEKNQRNTSASRTRQKLKRLGVEKCLEDWALSKNETQGFTLLVENGMPQYTAEAVVLKHPNRFPAHVVESAKKRLESHKVDLSLIQKV